MPVPEFIVDLRQRIGHDPLWLMAASGVVLREIDGAQQVLLVRNAEDGVWTVTAGIVEPGEEPACAVTREVHEEAGVICRAERLAWAYVEPPTVHPSGDRAQYLELVFACAWVAGDPAPVDGEASDARWWPIDHLPAMQRYQRARIAAALAGGPAWVGHDEGMRRAGES